MKEIKFVFGNHCPHCKAFEPVWEEVKALRPDIKFTKLEVTPQLVKELLDGHDNVPALVLFDDDKKIAHRVGNITKEVFVKYLDDGIAPPLVSPEVQKAKRLGWLYAKLGELTTRTKIRGDDSLAKEIANVNVQIDDLLMNGGKWQPEPDNCKTCGNREFKPWRPDFWRTACAFCLRCQGALLLAIVEIMAWVVVGVLYGRL